MSILVNIKTAALGFRAHACQDGCDYVAIGSSPELAARIVGAALLELSIADVQAEQWPADTFAVTPRDSVPAQEKEFHLQANNEGRA